MERGCGTSSSESYSGTVLSGVFLGSLEDFDWVRGCRSGELSEDSSITSDSRDVKCIVDRLAVAQSCLGIKALLLIEITQDSDF